MKINNNKQHSTSYIKHLTLGLIAFSLIVAGLWYFSTKPGDGISPYNPTTDRSFIIDVFKNDRYWLVTDYNPNFSVEHMLDKRSSNEEPGRAGDLTIVTYRVSNKPVGFVAYYMRELLEGFILYLGVGREYRGKGYSRKLLNHAMDDLKKRGARILRLQTRVENKQARGLYESAGFKQFWTDGAYIQYQKEV